MNTGFGTNISDKVIFESARKRRLATRMVAAAVIGSIWLFLPINTLALNLGSPDSGSVGTTQILVYAAFLGTLAYAAFSTVILLKSRNKALSDRDAIARELANWRTRSERFESLMHADDQRIIFWSMPNSGIMGIGNLPDNSGAPDDIATFMEFHTWLVHASAIELERQTKELRAKGTAFQIAVQTLKGNYIDAFGRASGGRIFIRFRDLSGDQQVLMELRRKLEDYAAEIETFQLLLQQIEQPVWLHKDNDEDNKSYWVNNAYCLAVGAENNRALETPLLDRAARELIMTTHEKKHTFKRRVQAISKGARRTFEVVSVPTSKGCASIATDISEAQKAYAALNRTIQSHEKTFNELATAVAKFDKNHRLTFHNKAYQELFGLDTSFLRSHPTDSEVLDRLRSRKKLPVEANFREWKTNLLKTHQSLEMKEFIWHLPDGQTLRVFGSPQSTGDVTWIYENLTAKLNLESRVNVLSRLQGETLNRLTDGVAVFSSDGRLTLANTSFGRLWKLEDSMLADKPHIQQLADQCVHTHKCRHDWNNLKMAIVGVSDKRADTSGTMERPDGSVLRYSTNALIDGRVMVTFNDITDSVNFQRALMEADQLKNSFVQHVSYELRSPLTVIIGFTQLLADADMGPLTIKQREYTEYILSSSSSLLAIINDILDLATADAGVLELDFQEISIENTITGAAEGLHDRLSKRKIELVTNMQDDIGVFIGDERRIRQILFNLLANAIKFSDDGGRIELSVYRSNKSVFFKVQDWGAGISNAFVDQIFNRFESRASGQNRGGVGLGLSIVKQLVDLHQGDITVESKEGEGTMIICQIPASPPNNVPSLAAQ